MKKPARRKDDGARRKDDGEPYVEEARALAEEFIENAPAKVDEAIDDLDYSIDSIRVIDRACRFQRKGFDDRYILCAGFYFGEMLRRAYDGHYRWDAKTNALALDIEGLAIFPIEKVRKVVSGQDNANMQEFLLVLAKRIADQRGYGKKTSAKLPAVKPPAPGEKPPPPAEGKPAPEAPPEPGPSVPPKAAPARGGETPPRTPPAEGSPSQ